MAVQLIRKVRDRQPLSKTNVVKRFGVSDVYLPITLQNNLAGYSPATNTTYLSFGQSSGYNAFKTTANDNFPMRFPLAAAWSSYLIVIAENESHPYGLIDDAANIKIRCGEGNIPVLYIGETLSLTPALSQSVTKGSVIFASFNNANYVLAHKPKNGIVEYSTNNWADGNSTGHYLSANINARTALIAHWRDKAPPREDVICLLNNPWQIFEPETIPLFFSTAGGATNLLISDASHGHAADNLAFSLDTYLAAQDSAHAHIADNLTLDTSLSTNLVLAEALHGLSSDTVSLITGSYLQVADSLHGHSADVITLATASFLAVVDAIHSHSSDNLTLDTSNSTPLTLQDATHAHSADNTVFTLDTWLAIVDSVHAHSADNLSISSEELLAIADALHSLASDALILAIPSPPGTCPTAAEIAAAIIAAAQVTPIYADIRKVNNLPVNGSGTDGDPWGP